MADSDRHVVLILGAGASCPYGFPIGARLVDEICDHFVSMVHDDRPGNRGVKAATHAEDFCRRLRHSRRLTIDSFLEGATEVAQMGKVAIARILLACENEDSLTRPKDASDDWYRRLLNWLVSPGNPHQPLYKVSVITYNYDRSLEKIIHLCLRSFGLTDSQVATFMKALPIVHVHGRFGRLPWESSNEECLEYGSHPDGMEAAAMIASKGMKIVFDEGIDQSQALLRAQELLRTATHVFFMGFGYDETNVARLKLAANCPKSAAVSGTSYKLSRVEQIDKQALLERQFGRDQISLTPCRCLEFMDSNPLFM